MKRFKIAELILDFDLYPRNNVDSHNVTAMVDALSAGIELPPVIIDRKSRRVVDGFHRIRAHRRFHGKDAEVYVVEKSYATDAEIFLDAARYNAAHGAKLDPCDRAHCIIIAERLQIPYAEIAGALHMPLDRVKSLRQTRVAKGSDGLSIPLKRTVAGFHGRRLTKRQQVANNKLSGMSQSFYANQLIELIESEMLDLEDENLIDRLRKLHDLLESVLVAK